MHNSVFGKTMGNVNGRMELKLTTDCEKTIKRFSKLHVKVSRFCFCDGLHMIDMYWKTEIVSKPVYVGTTV